MCSGTKENDKNPSEKRKDEVFKLGLKRLGRS